MSLLSDRLAAARAENRAALIGYLPAGFPSVDGSIEALRAMVEGGVDMVEVGLPYSDPLMDGPAIQAAAQAALEGGVTTADMLRVVREVAATGTPTLVMSYWNPIEQYGVDRFAKDLAAAGGSGVITPDLIPDEAAEWIAASDACELDRVFLVAPSSSDARLRYTAGHCRGFVYATGLMGVTGVNPVVGATASTLVGRVREVCDLPVCVGLGVSTPDQARDVAGFADGVIVGSAFVRLLLDAASPAAGIAAVRSFAGELASALTR